MKSMDEEFMEVTKLGEKITYILPREPKNVGVPLMALEFAKNIYTNYIRRALPESQQESFELYLREMQIKVQALTEQIDQDIP